MKQACFSEGVYIRSEIGFFQTPIAPPHAVPLIACNCRSPSYSGQYGCTYGTYAQTGEPSVNQASAPKASCPLAPFHLATSMLAPLCVTSNASCSCWFLAICNSPLMPCFPGQHVSACGLNGKMKLVHITLLLACMSHADLLQRSPQAMLPRNEFCCFCSDHRPAVLARDSKCQPCRGVHLHPATAQRCLYERVSAQQSLAQMTARFSICFCHKKLLLQPYCLCFLLICLFHITLHVIWHITSRVS